MNHGKVARDPDAMISQADATGDKVCRSLHAVHKQRAKYFKEGMIHKQSLKDTVLVERHHKDVLTRHCQQSWYISGFIVRKIGQDVDAVQVGENKILDQDRRNLGPRAPDPSGRAVAFEFTAGDPDFDGNGEEEDYTAERILTDKADRTTPGRRLYKVGWKGFATLRDSWEHLSSFVLRYTTVWLDYLKKKAIDLDVKDVLVHLIMHKRNGDDSSLALHTA